MVVHDIAQAAGGDRRKFLIGAGGAAAGGAILAGGLASPARATGRNGHDHHHPPKRRLPKPIVASIPSGAPPSAAPFDQIHWLLPGPTDAVTPYIGLPGFGLDVDRSLIGDFHGFVAYAVISGQATGNDGEPYDMEVDIRVMDGKYVAEDGSERNGTFGFFWIDLFTPGTGVPAEQVHDFNPGILPNGLFWTMAIPNRSFKRHNGGRSAELHLEKLGMPDTFFFANNVSVAATVDVHCKWEAVSDFEYYGGGSSAPADDPSAFEGRFAEARCTGKVKGVETGFWFRSKTLSSDTFYSDMGWEKNGVFL